MTLRYWLLSIVFLSASNASATPARDWVGMKPCRIGNAVYLATKISPATNTDDGFHANAAPVGMTDFAKLLVEDEKVQLHLTDVELVDGTVSSRGHWALLRSSHAKLGSLKIPKCRLKLSPSPSKGCPEWTYPHAIRKGEHITAAVGFPVGNDTQKSKARTERVLKALMNMLLDAKVSARPGKNGNPMGSMSAEFSELKELNSTSVTCGGSYWRKSVYKRLRK